MKQKAYLLISILLFSLTVFGQSQEKIVSSSMSSKTKIDLQRNIRFENDSKSEEIVINIREKTKRFELMINSRVSKGKLTIDLYDPSGLKQGTFTLGTQLNSEKHEIANGNIRKSLNEPQFGDWKVVLIPINSTGDIRIQTAISEDDYYIHVPESFSPNGVNIFKVESKNISDTIDFKIYNRFGKLVFESQNINNGWDGMSKGEILPVGAYYYVFRAKTLFGYEVVKNGPLYIESN